MGEVDLHGLFQSIGEVVRGLEGLAETIEIRHSQTERLDDLLRSDFSTLRSDQRQLDEKMESAVLLMQQELRGLQDNTVAGQRAIDGLFSVVQELQIPVGQILALRTRVAGLMLGVSIMGSALLWLAEPFYRWIVEQGYLRH